MLTDLKKNVEQTLADFKSGHPVLVGDDGIRENEIDLVFHGEFATPDLVNLALQHGKGLLCVSLGQPLADRLALASAPQYPAKFGHTAFTVSLDAKNNVTSGISAKDRSTTIRLLANDTVQPNEFTSPGHVFPLRAKLGGLLERAGHTEAAVELCRLAGMKEVAAIVEVLNECGEPVRPASLQLAAKEIRSLSYVTTVEILWYQILLNRLWDGVFTSLQLVDGFKFVPAELGVLATPCAFRILGSEVIPETVSICISNGFKTIQNETRSASAEIILINIDEQFLPVGTSIDVFCDLSHKDGLQATQPAVRRFVTLVKTLEFLRTTYSKIGRTEWFEKIKFPIEADKILVNTIVQTI